VRQVRPLNVCTKRPTPATARRRVPRRTTHANGTLWRRCGHGSAFNNQGHVPSTARAAGHNGFKSAPGKRNAADPSDTSATTLDSCAMAVGPASRNHGSEWATSGGGAVTECVNQDTCSGAAAARTTASSSSGKRRCGTARTRSGDDPDTCNGAGVVPGSNNAASGSAAAMRAAPCVQPGQLHNGSGGCTGQRLRDEPVRRAASESVVLPWT
jgi:hypothetical protein